MASVELAAATTQTETVPAASETDPPLAKAELSNNAGSTSVITCLRNGKIHCAAPVGEEGEYVRETGLQTPRSADKKEE